MPGADAGLRPGRHRQRRRQLPARAARDRLRDQRREGTAAVRRAGVRRRRRRSFALTCRASSASSASAAPTTSTRPGWPRTSPTPGSTRPRRTTASCSSTPRAPPAFRRARCSPTAACWRTRATSSADQGFGPDSRVQVAMPLFHVGGTSYSLMAISLGRAHLHDAHARSGGRAGDARGREDHAHLLRARADGRDEPGAGRRRARLFGPEGAVVRRVADAAAGDARLAEALPGRHAAGLRHDRAERRGQRARPGGPRRSGGGAPARVGGQGDPRRRDRDPRPRHRRAGCHRRARRDLGAQRPGHGRLLGQARGHGRDDHARRLAALRRRRLPGRRRLPLHHRPHQGHDHQRRREHLPGRDRARAGRAPAGPGRRGDRRARTSAGARCRRRSSSPRPARRSTPSSCSPGAANAWRRSSARRRVDVVAELPRNPTGKILKKDLRKPYWEGRERQVV